MKRFFDGILSSRARRGWPGLILKWGSVPALCLAAVMLWAGPAGAEAPPSQVGIGAVQGGGSTFNGGTIGGDLVIQKTAPFVQVDSTEAVTNGTQMDGLFMFSRNNYNAGDTLYNVLAGFSYNCRWDPSQNAGNGGWVKTLGGSPGRGCWMFGTSISGDLIVRYKTNNLDATGTVYTDASFVRWAELIDMTSGLSAFDRGMTLVGGVVLTTSGVEIPTVTDTSFNPIFKFDTTTGFTQWVNNGQAKPTCAAGIRGAVFYVPGAAGVLDTFEVCRKDAANAYAWVTLF